MNQLNLRLTRSNEPPAFNIPQERISDPIGPVQVALREGAMDSGSPSVTMVIPLAGGMYCIVETTWKLWNAASSAFTGGMTYWKENPIP